MKKRNRSLFAGTRSLFARIRPLFAGYTTLFAIRSKTKPELPKTRKMRIKRDSLDTHFSI
ncbi:hypothetical protein [Planococcus halocryophilus]|uniref:hypothetical protein n=1 Tax=Planococcus halocryophilus TaxID=1215089 RepID=UPI0012DCC0F2|nr:hypothetical protein [Planococcus halocryophilus]